MCGIIVALEAKPISQSRFNNARDALKHRGPDAQHSIFFDSQTVALGHTRLSVIDLSTRANQPMHRGNLVITYNGEVYNFRALRDELVALGHSFDTSSDTEVLLRGFQEWGSSLCKRLVGMFAFAIWDEKSKSLFMARDHLGQKPLYYSYSSNGFVAASEIKAIRQYSTRPFRMRKESLVDALVQDFVAEPDTWFEGISALPAGHHLTLRLKKPGDFRFQLQNYWQFEPQVTSTLTRDEALYEINLEVEQAVRSHLVADVPVGAFLSGGMDSTVIAHAASEFLKEPIKTFSIGFGAGDELPIARQTSQQIGSCHTEAVVKEEDFRNSIEQSLQVFSQPFADTSLVPTLKVSKLAREHVKVVLTGDGGDECFGGYDYGKYLRPGISNTHSSAGKMYALKNRVMGLIDRMRFVAMGYERWAKAARSELVNSRKPSATRLNFLAPTLLKTLSGYDPSASYQRHRSLKRDPFRDAQWVGIKVPLPGKMLAKVDRCAMSCSLETRAPFLSPRLIEFVLSLPRNVSNPTEDPYKWLLKKSQQNSMSAAVLGASKRGFNLPKTWNAVNPHLLTSGKEIFPECVKNEILRPMAWQQMADKKQVLWRFLQIERGLANGILSL